MEPGKKITVEIAYATPQKQQLMTVEIEFNTTIETAIQRSGILQLFPEIDLNVQKVGVFGKQKKLTDVVQQGDRIEIYRPLIIDPKEARKKRVIKKLNKKIK